MTKLVGILNLTPDSFSDGGKYVNVQAALEHAVEMYSQGASIVDLGAESTRPGAMPLDSDEEWKRLGPVFTELIKSYSGRISVDTYHPETADRVLRYDDVIINDVTGFKDPAMTEVLKVYKPRVVLCHLKGTNVQAAHGGELISDINTVLYDLKKAITELHTVGITHDRIIVDPGIGFGKTPELNRELLKFAELMPDYKVMIGYSRKRFLGENRMGIETNLDAGRIAASSGAAYLRVHDVLGHNELLY
jgi:dihydropteroate synthase